MYLIYEEHFITLYSEEEGSKIGPFIVHMYLNIKQIPLYFTCLLTLSKLQFF